MFHPLLEISQRFILVQNILLSTKFQMSNTFSIFELPAQEIAFVSVLMEHSLRSIKLICVNFRIQFTKKYKNYI